MSKWLLRQKDSLNGVSLYNSGWWNTWSVEAMKTVAKYEKVGEP